jgi:hypothetical protein
MGHRRRIDYEGRREAESRTFFRAIQLCGTLLKGIGRWRRAGQANQAVKKSVRLVATLTVVTA